MSSTQTLVMETTQGNIELELFTQLAPKACENFLEHAKSGYYEGIAFHRIIKDFMIQGGDPSETGAGGESIWGAPFEDEVSLDVAFDTPGKLAMANAGPHTNGSQFFITTVETPWLNMRHTIFGQVTSGMDIVSKLEGVDTDPADRPVEAQRILKIAVKN